MIVQQIMKVVINMKKSTLGHSMLAALLLLLYLGAKLRDFFLQGGYARIRLLLSAHHAGFNIPYVRNQIRIPAAEQLSHASTTAGSVAGETARI